MTDPHDESEDDDFDRSDDDGNDVSRDAGDDEEDGNESRNRDRQGGFDLQSLSELLARLRTIAEEDRVRVQSSIRTSSVEDFLNQRKAEDRAEAESARSPPEIKTGAGYHVDTQFEGDEFVVVADLLGASVGELSAGVAPSIGELVIQRDGETVARVPLPWETAEATRAWFNNGILEIRLRAAV